MNNDRIDGAEITDRVAPVNSKGSDPAFFSCWDIHSYYGESYIVQGVSFDIRDMSIFLVLQNVVTKWAQHCLVVNSKCLL